MHYFQLCQGNLDPKKGFKGEIGNKSPAFYLLPVFFTGFEYLKNRSNFRKFRVLWDMKKCCNQKPGHTRDFLQERFKFSSSFRFFVSISKMSHMGFQTNRSEKHGSICTNPTARKSFFRFFIITWDLKNRKSSNTRTRFLNTVIFSPWEFFFPSPHSSATTRVQSNVLCLNDLKR